MFKWLTTTKRGFSLVELMIVLVLMSLGFVAFINLFRSIYKSYEKTEEKYIKQEAVKTVVEYLQKQAKVGSSTTVEVYNSTTVIPPDNATIADYAYLYVKNGILYVRNPKSAPHAINSNTVPLYIYFEPYVIDGETRCAFSVNVAALENGVMNADGSIKTTITQNGVTQNVYDANGKIKDDFIFYRLSTAYHFPNMLDKGVNTVNYNNAVQAFAYAYSNGAITGTLVNSNNSTGVVARFISDSSLLFDSYTSSTQIQLITCFVASASYGVDSPDVGLLCNFRDSILLKTDAGKWFVDKYYTYSPPIAEKIKQNEGLRFTTRVLLKPVVAAAYVALNPEWLVILIPLAGGMLLTIVRRKQKVIKSE